MTDEGTRRLEMFLRVQQYAATHAVAFPADSRGKELFDEIGSAVTDLQAQSTAQDSHRLGARQGTALISAARESLRDDLEAMTDTARAVARTVHGFDEQFRLPDRLRDQELLTRARAFAQAAEPVKQEFTRRGLPADFLEHLSADIAAFEQLIAGRVQDEGARNAATAAIDAAIEHGTQAVRELDAVVRNTFRDDPAALAEWTSASHVERAPRATAAPEKPQGEPAK